MENIEEKACLCALNRIFGFEPRIASALLGHFGSARRIFELSPDELEAVTGPYSRYRGRICRNAADQAAEELLKLEKDGIGFCGITEESYPGLLKECCDAPVGIYIRSSSPPEELWNSRDSIGIVGTRDISPYGREWCSRIVDSLSRSPAGPTIVSGLALGTDIEAHRTALSRGLPTIGVMATGPDIIYPASNRKTAEQMARTPGCALVTDYPPGTAPLAIHFLRRNRIIAGLSKAVILVESKIKGGGMSTCRLAFSYDRDVFALPGRIDDLRSQGCNSLIRQKIAEPLTSIEAMFEGLGMTECGRRRKESLRERLTAAFADRTDAGSLDRMHTLLQAVSRQRGMTVEELSISCGYGYSMTAQALGMLEMEGFISIDLLQRCSINYKNV